MEYTIANWAGNLSLVSPVFLSHGHSLWMMLSSKHPMSRSSPSWENRYYTHLPVLTDGEIPRKVIFHVSELKYVVLISWNFYLNSAKLYNVNSLSGENNRNADDLHSLPAERPSSLSTESSPSPLRRSPPPLVTANAVPALPTLEASPTTDHQGLRYSFRKRNAAQLAPYTADLIQYKRALRHNPDAIIKMKQIERQLEQEQQHRRPDDHYEDEGFADQLNREEREWRRRRRLEKMKETLSVQDLSHYPTILQDLSTDDEEKEMDAASKAARKILRVKERAQRARENEDEKRRRMEERSRTREDEPKQPKPFPFSKSKHESSNRRSPFYPQVNLTTNEIMSEYH